MSIAETFFGSPDFQRGRWGWAEVTLPDGNGTDIYRRATTVAGYLDDKQGLIDWSAAMVAFGMAKSPALMANFQLLDWHEDKGKVKEMLSKAKDLGGGSEAADTGTAFHKVVEMYHLGREIDRENLPAGFAETLAAYEQFLADWGLACVGTEIKIVDDEHRIAGTADLALKARQDIETPFGVIPEGSGFIADVKSGSVSDYSGLSMGIQLGIYSHGQPYDVLNGKRVPWHVSKWTPGIGLIIKVDVKSHTVTPWWLNLDAAYELVPLAMQVARMRGAGKKLISKAEYEPSGPKGATWYPIGKVVAKSAPAPEDLPPLEEFTPVEEMAKEEAAVQAENDDTNVATPEPQAPVELETVQIEDQAPAPKEKTRAETIAEEAAACANVGQARELYKKWIRGGASAEELALIATRAADLGAKMKEQ